MMWNEEEAVKEAIVDIIRFLDNLDCYEEDVEPELRGYIQQKYGIYSEAECIPVDNDHPIRWKHNIILRRR